MAVEGRGEELKKLEREGKTGGNGKGEEMLESVVEDPTTRRPVRERKVCKFFFFFYYFFEDQKFVLFFFLGLFL